MISIGVHHLPDRKSKGSGLFVCCADKEGLLSTEAKAISTPPGGWMHRNASRTPQERSLLEDVDGVAAERFSVQFETAD